MKKHELLLNALKDHDAVLNQPVLATLPAVLDDTSHPTELLRIVKARGIKLSGGEN